MAFHLRQRLRVLHSSLTIEGQTACILRFQCFLVSLEFGLLIEGASKGQRDLKVVLNSHVLRGAEMSRCGGGRNSVS